MLRSKQGQLMHPPLVRTKWVEVNLDDIAHNVSEVRRFLRPGVAVVAVIKADAYGHGAVPVARTALGAGADYLGVTSIQEALELRAAALTAPILVLGAILPAEAMVVVENDLTATVFTTEIVHQLNVLAGLAGKKVKVHIKVDTGMGRYGISTADAVEFTRQVAKLENLALEGIYTHFAAAFTTDRTFTLAQFARFKEVLAALTAEGINIPFQHAASSAAVLRYPETHLTMVRVGALLYGQGPVPEISTLIQLRPAWQLKARLTVVHSVPAGTNIGYGQDFRLKQATTIGVLPIGFADGFQVQPVNRPVTPGDLLRSILKEIVRFFNSTRFRDTVTIDGKAFPLIGRVGMQHCVVDLGSSSVMEAGMEAVLDGKRSTVNPRITKFFWLDGRMTRLPYPDGESGVRPVVMPLRLRRFVAAAKNNEEITTK